jgi:hypothetical protein
MRSRVKNSYQVEISNRLAALETLNAAVNINEASETIRENIKISAKESGGYYELKQGMFKIIRSKETSQTSGITGSKRNKWG